MTGQDGNSAMKGWVEAVFGRPGQLWIDGRAANETLQLREENKRLRQENEILRKQRDAYQQSSDRRFAALVEKEKERAADLAGHDLRQDS